MSNIANQLVAVVATLLGFVAHDALTERGRPATVVASVADASVDPVVTRAIDLNDISADWMNTSARAERAGQLPPGMPASDGTGAVRTAADKHDTRFAAVRANDLHFGGRNRAASADVLR